MGFALITGGSSGIGLAIAKRLAQQGLDVWLLARDPERLQRALEEVRRLAPQGRHQALSCDVRDQEAVQRVVAQAGEQNGAPPLWVINSAGTVRPGYFGEIPPEAFREMMEVNYFGTLHVCRAVVPAMQQARRGRIVNLSSVAGFLGVFGYTGYSASKFAVWGFSEALRAELRPWGISVSVVFPPDTDTPQLAAEEPYKPPELKALASTAGLLTPDEVARVTLRQAARGRFLIWPGEARWLWLARRLMGSAAYSLMDWLIRRAARQETGSGRSP